MSSIELLKNHLRDINVNAGRCCAGLRNSQGSVKRAAQAAAAIVNDGGASRFINAALSYLKNAEPHLHRLQSDVNNYIAEISR